jgi:hypothetical protein
MHNAEIMKVGICIRWKGQPYLLMGIEPYRRRDGKPSRVLLWRSWCAECGETFDFKAPHRKLRDPSRRCQLHAKPGLRVR